MATPAGQNSAWAALIEALPPLAAAAVAAYVSWKIAVWRTREGVRIQQEKDLEIRKWELRRVGYSAVLAKLREVSKYAGLLHDGYNDRWANAHQFDGSKECLEYSQKLWRTWAECQTEFENEELDFSGPFISAFRKLERSLPNEHDYDHDLPPGMAARVAKCFRNGRSAVRRAARREFVVNEKEERTGTKSVGP